MTDTRFAVRRLAAASLLLLGVAVGACSEDTPDNGGSTPLPASATYKGLIASTDGRTGPLSITFASPVKAPPAPQPAGTGPAFSGGAPVTATGTLQLGSGASVPITGSINGGILNMSGGGWTITGNLNNGQVEGTFTGPAGETGSLAALAYTDGSPAAAFCGTFSGLDYTDDPPTEDLGSFSAVIGGDIILGTAVGDGGTAADFSGTATSTGFTVTEVTAEGTLNATGTWNVDGISGTYNVKVGNFTASSGTFTGDVCGSIPL